ncbi:tRNA (adenine-N1)-methyltransferase [Brevibacterium samyangense]|uniref:tRNA (adenine(58)-N(1))-methyltransferase catalytic subunit TRM61 C-terminal domain-containing protein n=1 Tax=Brevibacterium samyangense TaxID=366888 RepID=A0ABP5F2F9_9MICO
MTSSVPSTDPTSVPLGAADRRGPLKVGDKVQLTDPKGRLHTVVLHAGEAFHTHKGLIRHDDLIGRPEGIVVENSGGVPFQVLRPLLEDFVLSMPRGAAVVYAKDAALIVTMADIYPGATVVEAGVGSGALTLSLLRAVGDHGTVHSFERREEFAQIAAGNIKDFFGAEHPGHKLTVGDLVEELPQAYAPGTVDRVVLDMLAPWECLDAVATALVPGGVVICYVATATQLSRTAEAMRASGRFTEPTAFESMVREWHLEGLAVRPEHRMIGHTGFLVMARTMAPGEETLERKKRPQAAEPSAEDREAWEGGEITDAALGNREATPKKLRRVIREVGKRERAIHKAAAREAADDEAVAQDATATHDVDTPTTGNPVRGTVEGAAGETPVPTAPEEDS